MVPFTVQTAPPTTPGPVEPAENPRDPGFVTVLPGRLPSLSFSIPGAVRRRGALRETTAPLASAIRSTLSTAGHVSGRVSGAWYLTVVVVLHCTVPDICIYPPPPSTLRSAFCLSLSLSLFLTVAVVVSSIHSILALVPPFCVCIYLPFRVSGDCPGFITAIPTFID
jgi:hypothetical protein